MFNFQPLTEQECLNLLPDGEYSFLVKDAESTTSKRTGLPMMKLILDVYDHKGRAHSVTDYLIESLMYKVKHFCDSVGLEKEYSSGQFTPNDCINKSGMVKIIVDEPSDPKYLPKNAVKDYIKPQLNNDSLKANEIVDDKIPF